MDCTQNHFIVDSPLPTPQRSTPKTAYQDLLELFGSQSSPTSVTKAKRISNMGTPLSHPVVANDSSDSERKSKHNLKGLAQRHNHVGTPVTPQSELPPTTAYFSTPTSRKAASKESLDSSDELSQDTTWASPLASKLRRADMVDELKMEKRTKERDNSDSPRRSLRRKSNILESDTITDVLTLTSPKRKAPPRPKLLDTARQRLRHDIATHAKTKANNFLVAHKDYFCPLLPQNNYITKLSSNTSVASLPAYEQITEQPQGVVANMKPYQLSGLSFLVHLYRNGMSGILGDEMGLGKTLQTLSMFQYLEEEDRKSGSTSEELRPYLVICPLSVLNSWVSEAEKWVPELKVLSFHGTPNERQRLKKVAMGMEDEHGQETRQSHDRKASKEAGHKISKLPTADLGADSFKIIVTTYDTFSAEQNWFKHSFVWRYVVLDEGHKIKNSTTQLSMALKNISSEYRLILTGTPVQNNLQELWALLAWLFPDVFVHNTKELFQDSFNLTLGKVNNKTMDDSRRLLELIMLRRMKDSPGVDLGLPEKEEILLYVPLTPMQRFWYTRLLTRAGDDILEDIFSDIQSKEKEALQQEKKEDELTVKMEKWDRDVSKGTLSTQGAEWGETVAVMRDAMQKEKAVPGTRTAWLKLMNLVMQLRKCCSHPYLIPGAVSEDYDLGRHVINASGKFIVLEKLLKHRVSELGKKVLIFSGFTRTLDLCEELLDLIGSHGRGFRFLRLDGGTARARRNLGIRLFNDPKSDYKVMLLSTRAGGLGINLTRAEDVIFLDEDWNPQITLQAEARAHRIGQTKKVTIFKLCAQGTVEEQMMGRIRKKLYLSTKITESMQNIHVGGTPEKVKGGTMMDDMPQLSTNQLTTLIRRGAQTLSHPKINETEMLSWDIDTILERCRDKPGHNDADSKDNSGLDEEKWLSTMERVQCAVFDGKRYQRRIEKAADTNSANILPDSISREDRRKGKNVTVMVDGFAVNKESLNCADWEAVPTLAGKDPRLAEPKYQKKQVVAHEDHCLVCFGQEEGLTNCAYCPRSCHLTCLENPKVTFANFVCPQHGCLGCGHRTADAGGLLFRCRWCENAYCEDCLEWGQEELIGENLIEFEMLGVDSPRGGFYIKCPACKSKVEQDAEHSEWLSSMEQSYIEQYDDWLAARDKDLEMVDRKLEEESPIRFHLMTDYDTIVDTIMDDAASPPALTDTSLATPAPGDSGVATPEFPAIRIGEATKRKTPNIANGTALANEKRLAKKARLGQFNM